MEQRISIITLGVADLSRARTFYERLGWRGQEMEETVFFQAGSMALILWGRAKLAEDSGVADTGAGGFDGVVLAHNLRSRAEVDALMASAVTAGAEDRAAGQGDLLRRLRGLLPRPGWPRLGDRLEPRLHPRAGRLARPARLRLIRG